MKAGGFFSPAVFQGERNKGYRLPQCGLCGLAKGCKSPKIPPAGRGKRSILFVTGAPGDEEDEDGSHFTGKDGQFLRGILKKLRIRLTDCYQTTAVICKPPEETLDKHIECCRPNILKTIRDLKPTVVILLGGVAVKSLMPTEREGATGSIDKWVGWAIPSHEHQAWLCPTYDLRDTRHKNDDTLTMLLTRHLEAAIALEATPVPGESLRVLKGEVDVITSPRQGRNRLRALVKRQGLLAFDYECTGLKPEDPRQRIVSCSFCLDGSGTFALMVDEENQPLISKILKKPELKKIASNLKYEERWTRKKMGHGVAGWYWDTMQAAHILDNRKAISSVKFQAFIHLGIADYQRVVEPFFASDEEGFNRIDEIPVDELLLYNGLDSLLEFKVAMKQRKAMGFDE